MIVGLRVGIHAMTEVYSKILFGKNYEKIVYSLIEKKFLY
jgi:hypothetical protein